MEVSKPVSGELQQELCGSELNSNTQNHSPIEGGDLIRALLSSTGLPENEVGEELSRILETSGASPATLTLDELRNAMLLYLESTLAEVQAGPSEELSEEAQGLGLSDS